jgi:hypothetical protein
MGASGPRALVKNFKVFSIALVACLGGVLYGYNQGMFSGILAMPSFGKRELPLDISQRPNSNTSQRRTATLIIRHRRDGLLLSSSLELGLEHSFPGSWQRFCHESTVFYVRLACSSSVLLSRLLQS